MQRLLSIGAWAVVWGVSSAVAGPEQGRAAPTTLHAQALVPDGVIVLSAGDVVNTPEIEPMSCAERRSVLARIDATNYRGLAPLPVGHPDFALFAYEDELAAAIFRDCTLLETRAADTDDLFRFGF